MSMFVFVFQNISLLHIQTFRSIQKLQTLGSFLYLSPLTILCLAHPGPAWGGATAPGPTKLVGPHPIKYSTDSGTLHPIAISLLPCSPPPIPRCRRLFVCLATGVLHGHTPVALPHLGLLTPVLAEARREREAERGRLGEKEDSEEGASSLYSLIVHTSSHYTPYNPHQTALSRPHTHGAITEPSSHCGNESSKSLCACSVWS